MGLADLVIDAGVVQNTLGSRGLASVDKMCIRDRLGRVQRGATSLAYWGIFSVACNAARKIP